MGKKAVPKKLTIENVAVYNKGAFRKDLSQPPRYFVSTKAKVTTLSCKNKKRRCSYQPEFKCEGGGVFASAAAAWEHAPAFVAMLNGERPPSKRVKEQIATPQKSAAAASEALGQNLKRQRAAGKKGAAREAEFLAAIKKKARSNSGAIKATTAGLLKHLRPGANKDAVANLMVAFAEAEKNTREAANSKRSAERAKGKAKPKTSESAGYQRKRHKRVMKQMKIWEHARDHLAPFIKEGTTDGLVITEDGVDLSNDGHPRILRKATLVHMYCKLRLLGMSRAETTEVVTEAFPESERMSSGRTLRTYLAEYFANGGFLESKNGKWARKNVFSNTALKYAMKEWIRKNQYTVITDEMNPEERKYFIAKHACDHLNKLLEQHPRFKCSEAYAASTPVNVKTMRVYMKKHLGLEWKPNKKGTANATHDRHDAVGQRNEYVFNNRDRELQNLVWHKIEMTELRCMHPHLHDVAIISKGVAAETLLVAKRKGHKPSNELLHNMHCYKDGEKEMVEFHVDFLEVGERFKLYPFWGGTWSTRADFTKPLVEEAGQDEAAFHQYDERKNHWHEVGKQRLSMSEKGRGSVSHCAVVTRVRTGCGGNLIHDDTWEAYEKVRVQRYGKYDGMYKNPFMVWDRVGGDNGYWGGKEVAQQFKECQQFDEWEREQEWYKKELAALNYPGPQQVITCFGADRSQTHLLGKPDGIVMTKFNLGTKFRSTTNERTAAKFCIPRDVVLQEGDINTNPRPIHPPPASLPQANVEDTLSDEDSDEDLGLEPQDTQLDKYPNLPLGQSAISEEVAKEFDDEVFCGTITSFEEDDEDGLYHVVYFDGDEQDMDIDEYREAWRHAYALANPGSNCIKPRKPKKRRKKKKTINNKRYNPPTPLHSLPSIAASPLLCCPCLLGNVMVSSFFLQQRCYTRVKRACCYW
jgi:hypothetical protein